MYIEFALPESTLYTVVNNLLTHQLHCWSDQYQIPYNVKNIKQFKRITFDNEQHYVVFSMTWSDTGLDSKVKWRIVSDLNNKTKFNSNV
jgi:hypothetical protein